MTNLLRSCSNCVFGTVKFDEDRVSCQIKLPLWAKRLQANRWPSEYDNVVSITSAETCEAFRLND